MTDLALTNLRATVAMREVDLQIASKHYSEAAARVMTPANAAACERARVWMENRREARDDARGRLIRHAPCDDGDGSKGPEDSELDRLNIRSSRGEALSGALDILAGTPGYAAPSNHALTFAPDADPADTAKVSARLAKALKPACMDCGKTLSAKDLRAGRLCTDHTACRLRRILHGPKCPALTYGLA